MFLTAHLPKTCNSNHTVFLGFIYSAGAGQHGSKNKPFCQTNHSIYVFVLQLAMPFCLFYGPESHNPTCNFCILHLLQEHFQHHCLCDHSFFQRASPIQLPTAHCLTKQITIVQMIFLQLCGHTGLALFHVQHQECFSWPVLSSSPLKKKWLKRKDSIFLAVTITVDASMGSFSLCSLFSF